MAGEKGIGGMKARWMKWRKSGRLNDLTLFAVFVTVAGIFWLVLALNETVQDDLDVRIELTGVPDTVTFITDPPKVLHVSVRDKGTLLARRKFMQTPVLRLNFSEFASDGNFRVTPSVLATHMRSIFGSSAAINITSADSISLLYTSAPGKFVPVRIISDVTPALGKVVNGKLRASVREVKIFSTRDILDTISYVCTEPIIRRNLDASISVQVPLRRIKGVRMVPSSVEVNIPVEPLENRKTVVEVTPVNVPKGETLALFPAKVEVSYLVPMSMSDDAVTNFRVIADYASLHSLADKHIKIKLVSQLPTGVADASLEQDSVEYTIIRLNGH